MMQMWFCYEQEGNTWLPVVYRSTQGIPQALPATTPRSDMIEVPRDCIGSDGEPLFGRLKARFPLEVADG